jgi:hypothetical protein
MSDNERTRKKAMIRSVIVYPLAFLALVATNVALIVGTLQYIRPNLLQFDHETDTELRIFGLSVRDCQEFRV